MLFTLSPCKYGRRLVLRGRATALATAVARLCRITSIELNDGKGWRGSNLRFLRDLPPLREIILLGLGLESIDGLEGQAGIERLCLETYAKGRLSWQQFVKLRSLVVEAHLFGDDGWNLTELNDLFLINTKEENWTSINRLTELQKLDLTKAPITTFDGLVLPELRELGMHHCRGLNDVSGIEGVQRLERLHLTSCNRVTNLAAAGALTELRELVIMDCGEIDSLGFCCQLERLERLIFHGTRVRDGGLRQLLSLPSLREVGFDDRREYDTTLAECMARLRQKYGT